MPLHRYYQNVRFLTWENAGGSTCPPHGIFQVQNHVKSYSISIALGGKPDGEGRYFLINSVASVVSGKIGSCTFEHPMMVATSETSLAFGDTVGPVPDSWYVTSDGTGYLVVGDLSGGIVPVIRESDVGGSARRAKLTEDATCGGADENWDYAGTWTTIEFLDLPGNVTADAFYYDLGLGDILEADDPVSVVWSDVLPENPAAGPGGDTEPGWLIVTWPCPSLRPAGEEALPAPIVSNSDYNGAFSNDFGGPTGEFSNDFAFSFDNNYYNDALLEDLGADADVKGFWKLQETTGTNAADYSQNGNDGTLSGCNFATEGVDGPGGKYNNGLYVTGTDHVDCGDILAGGTKFSAFCWAKNAVAALPAHQTLMSHYNVTALRSWLFRITTAEKLQIYLSVDGTTTCQWLQTTPITSPNTWNHYGFTYDGDTTTLTVYMNNKLPAGSLVAGTVPSSLYNSTTDVMLGMYSPAGAPWTGDLSACIMASRIFTAAEIEALYLAGT